MTPGTITQDCQVTPSNANTFVAANPSRPAAPEIPRGNDHRPIQSHPIPSNPAEKTIMRSRPTNPPPRPPWLPTPPPTGFPASPSPTYLASPTATGWQLSLDLAQPRTKLLARPPNPSSTLRFCCLLTFPSLTSATGYLTLSKLTNLPRLADASVEPRPAAREISRAGTKPPTTFQFSLKIVPARPSAAQQKNRVGGRQDPGRRSPAKYQPRQLRPPR